MTTDDLRDALAGGARLAPETRHVRDAIAAGIRRRRTARRAAMLGCAGFAVAGVAVAPAVMAELSRPDTSARATAAAPAGVPGPPAAAPAGAPSGAPDATSAPAATALPPPGYLDDLVVGYLAEGYELEDARVLAGLWREEDLGLVKALAAVQLEDGVALPIAPGGAPAAAPLEVPLGEQAREAFAAAGYDDTDAAELAASWSEQDEDLAVVAAVAGQQLLNGRPAPVASPTPRPGEPGDVVLPGTGHVDAVVDTFFAQGYSLDDAAVLAGFWRSEDVWLVKALAGQRLTHGGELPIAPGGLPAGAPPAVSPVDEARDAFAAAGYDGADAQELAVLWSDTDEDLAVVEVVAGQLLLEGVDLPVAPS